MRLRQMSADLRLHPDASQRPRLLLRRNLHLQRLQLRAELRVSEHRKIDYLLSMAGIDARARVASALRAHDTKLKRLVATRVPPDVVDDVRQDAALRAIEKAETLRDPERILPWLYRIHENAALDAMRKSASNRRLLDAARREAVPFEPEVVEWCRCSIAQSRLLKPNYAAILDLVDIRGLSLADAARVLNTSINNATVRLHRARAALKKRMLDHCGVTSVNACADCRCVHEGCCPT